MSFWDWADDHWFEFFLLFIVGCLTLNDIMTTWARRKK